MWVVALGGALTAATLWITGLANLTDDALVTVLIISIIVAFATTGLVLIFRVPENRISWIYLAAGLAGGMWIAMQVYTETAPSQGWPGAPLAASLEYAAYFPWILLMVALPMLLFPDGRPPSRRWRWLTWVISGFMGTHVLVALFAGVPPPDNPSHHIPSPLESNAVRDFVYPSLEPLFLVLVTVVLLGPVVALVVRFRRADGVERQQLKWLALAASIAGPGLALVYTVGEMTESESTAWVGLVIAIALLAVLGIPIATGLAIVKYRLYDIDRLISRTLVYGLLVVLLAGVYAAGVFIVGTILPGEDNISVAVSTLAVAALFNPGRRRLQEAIDRRFFRDQYDAQEVVERLSDRLQDEVDLETVQEELLDAVEETVRPEASALWIRPS